jgi:quercetin dioxygenase-like cupin family protein
MPPVRNLSNAQKLEVPFSAWKLIENEANQLIEIILQPGEVIDKHSNPKSVFFFILKGIGTLTIDFEDYTLNEHDCIHVEKNLQRKLENKGISELRVLVIKQLL